MNLFFKKNNMCGIAGIYSQKNISNRDSIISKMIDKISYRGPDGRGFYINKSIALGHSRLSILDLSSAGNQPMTFKNLTIILNGEIYNFEEIKKILEGNGYDFESDCDTEVLLKAYHLWGDVCLDKIRGMYAFAIWDSDQEELFLARDIVGVKPLYYSYQNNILVFGSELRSIVEFPTIKKEIDFDALSEFLRFGYISAPNSIYQNIYKLKPGHFLRVKKDNLEIKKYWEIPSINSIIDITEEDAIKKTEELLKESFNHRMISDVPVGVFLSGGIDSSLVASILQSKSSSPIKTFTMGFHEKEFNESEDARKIAQYLKTDHREFLCSKKDAFQIIPMVADIYDEPFADDSFIPTYLLFKNLDKEIKVILSADGGDELFAGYDRYVRAEKLFKFINRTPKMVTEKSLDVLSFLNRIKPMYNFEARRKKIMNFYNDKDSLIDFYQELNSYWLSDEVNNLIKKDLSNSTNQKFEDFSLNLLQKEDFKKYLPDDCLVKVDRTSMQNGVESRDPFLGRELIEFAFSLPDNLKVKNGSKKYVLKKVLNKYIPNELTDRPKKGFGAPIDKWIKDKEFKEITDYYLSLEKIKKDDIFDAEIVEREKDNLLNKSGHSKKVWNLLIFQIWKEKWM